MARIDTDSIRAEPHVEVGTAIERDSALLVDRWARRALEEQPDARRVHHEILLDQLPNFLRAMGRALIQSGNPAAAQHCKTAFEHGDQRWESGWSLPALVRDYQILQLVILEHLELTLQRPLRYREAMAVGVFINDAISASIVSFNANRDEHLRRLDQQRTDALKEANRNKDEFIAVMAHELRNPLAPIVNSLRVVKTLLGKAEPSVLEAVGVIERQAGQLTRLVDDLLDLSRIAQGRLELRLAPTELQELVRAAIQTTEAAFQARAQRLAVTLPPEPVWFEADAVRIVQAIVNLLHNAAKYTDRGGEIALAARREGAEAVIEVRDNGTGIPPEYVSRIFDMFVQVEGARHSSNGGLGVGLTLVQRVVALHGGTVNCRSEGVGRGSEFSIRLPIKAGVQPVAAVPPRKPAEKAPPCHLLVIEDHADARNALAAVLRLSGHRVEVAENGRQGVEYARQSLPQVALVDIGLPDVDGYEVARQIRGANGERTFLIALTGFGLAQDQRKALAAGFDAHLVKPADFDELASLLAQVASGRAKAT